jgi:hypothetical protein
MLVVSERSLGKAPAKPVFILGIWIGLSLVLIGCGSQGKKPDWPSPVVATGKVTANGKPLDQARVFLVPDSGTPGQGASGSTDSEGNFSLFSISPDGKLVEGAIPGKYRVSVSRIVRPDGSVVSPDSQEPPIMSGGTESIPVQYSDARQSKLLATVSSAGTPILLDIKLK